MNERTRPVSIWRAPIILFIISLVGLFSALIADGWGDVVSWLSLAVPVLVIFYYWVK